MVFYKKSHKIFRNFFVNMLHLIYVKETSDANIWA